MCVAPPLLLRLLALCARPIVGGSSFEHSASTVLFPSGFTATGCPSGCSSLRETWVDRVCGLGLLARCGSRRFRPVVLDVGFVVSRRGSRSSLTLTLGAVRLPRRLSGRAAVASIAADVFVLLPCLPPSRFPAGCPCRLPWGLLLLPSLAAAFYCAASGRLISASGLAPLLLRLCGLSVSVSGWAVVLVVFVCLRSCRGWTLMAAVVSADVSSAAASDGV